MRLAIFIDQLQYFQKLDRIGPDAKITSIAKNGHHILIGWDNGDMSQVFDEDQISHWTNLILGVKSDESN